MARLIDSHIQGLNKLFGKGLLKIERFIYEKEPKNGFGIILEIMIKVKDVYGKR